MGRMSTPFEGVYHRNQLFGQVVSRILHPAFNEFTSGCTRKKNALVNQTVAKRAAHQPFFEAGQMCSRFCRLLIFTCLKN